MHDIWKRLGWREWTAIILLFAMFVCFGCAVLTTRKVSGLWLPASTGMATLLIAWLAVFSSEIAEKWKMPQIDLAYSHDTAEKYGANTWVLSLTVKKQAGAALRNAQVKCVTISPPPFSAIQSNRQPISPIPLKWAYWDAYKEMYGKNEGGRRALHRTVYRRDKCGILVINRSNGNSNDQSPNAILPLVIQLMRQSCKLEKDTQYTIELRVEADDYDSEKTWKFTLRWDGKWPTDQQALSASVRIERK